MRVRNCRRSVSGTLVRHAGTVSEKGRDCHMRQSMCCAIGGRCAWSKWIDRPVLNQTDLINFFYKMFSSAEGIVLLSADVLLSILIFFTSPPKYREGERKLETRKIKSITARTEVATSNDDRARRCDRNRAVSRQWKCDLYGRSRRRTSCLWINWRHGLFPDDQSWRTGNLHADERFIQYLRYAFC